MQFIVSELQVVNEFSPYPEFITNYQVIDSSSNEVELTTEDESKAHYEANKLNQMAYSRDL